MKSRLSRALRLLRLLPLLDYLRFLCHKIWQQPARRRFAAAHPKVSLPPDDLLYESFRLDIGSYFNDGAESARWLVTLVRDLLPPEPLTVLDWGCGPARILRHLPELLPGSSFCGADVNARAIHWCNRHLPGIRFTHVHPFRQLPFEADSFDWVYGISVITHLPTDEVKAVVKELWRLLKPGGWLLLTSQSDAFKEKMLPPERLQYDAGEAVMRGLVPPGHRLYSAFHPPQFMRNLLQSAAQVHHYKGHQKPGPAQDVWLAQKPLTA